MKNSWNKSSKRVLALLLVLVMVCGCLIGCNQQAEPVDTDSTTTSAKITTTTRFTAKTSKTAKTTDRITTGNFITLATGTPTNADGSVVSTTTTLPKREYVALDYTTVDVGNADVSDEALKQSYMYQGDLTRIANVLKKAERGEKIVVGAIGGSITEGVLWASDDAHKWPQLISKWFRETYPGLEVETVNAGIGSTGSVIGNGRANEDLFSKEPDLIVIEFARNDRGAENRQESYEGLVYRALTQSNNPAVMLLFMGGQDNTNCQDEQFPVGIKFDLPMISVSNAMIQGQKEGTYTWEDISPDNVHPNDRGYQLTADLITHRLEMVRQNMNKVDSKVPEVAETTSRFVDVNMGNCLTFEPLQLGDFQPQTGLYQDESLSKGWVAVKKGKTQSFVFETTSKCVVLVFKALTTPAATVNVYRDDLLIGSINGASTATWEYANYKTILLRDDTEKITLELELSSDSPYNSKFILLGVIQ